MRKFILFAALIAVFAFATEAQAQKGGVYKMTNPLGTAASPILSDTVTNTATAYLTSGEVKDLSGTATVAVFITEISGTTAGTITLQGSLDGTNFFALTDATSVPTVTTKTATDVASQSFFWRVAGNPCRFYRVSWTGTGTMSDYFSAQVVVR